MTRDLTHEKAVGALLGQAIGDALGCRYQYRSSADIIEQIKADRELNNFLPIRGSAVFSFPPGQVNSGIEFCMVVARSFSRTPTLSIPDFLESLIRWKKSEPIEDRSCVFDVIAPLEFNENRDPRIDQIIENEEELENYVNNNAYRINRRSLSNMCLNIAVPVAIVSIKLSSTASGTICNRLTKLTQPNPIAIDGVTVLTAALSSLMRNDDITVALKAATDSCKRPSILKHLTNCFKNAHPHGEDDLTREVHGENELPVDYLGIALQIAFYNLCHAKSFEEGIINAIEVGGDTATNASITGAVLGAKFGVSSIPEDWINTVVQAKLERHLTFPDVYFGDADNLVKLLILKGSL